jgi:hypothetical protein
MRYHLPTTTSCGPDGGRHGLGHLRGFGGISGRLDHPDTSAGGRGCEPLVVCHEATEVGADLLSAREVDGVQRSEFRRRQQPRRVEDAIADSQQVHPREHLPAPLNGVGPKGKERPSDLSPRKDARHQRPMAAQISS